MASAAFNAESVVIVNGRRSIVRGVTDGKELGTPLGIMLGVPKHAVICVLSIPMNSLLRFPSNTALIEISNELVASK